MNNLSSIVLMLLVLLFPTVLVTAVGEDSNIQEHSLLLAQRRSLRQEDLQKRLLALDQQLLAKNKHRRLNTEEYSKLERKRRAYQRKLEDWKAMDPKVRLFSVDMMIAH